MRAVRSIVFLLFALHLGFAETIVLKNGRRIVVDSVREQKDKILYEVGEGSYAIPKSSVDRIEKGSPSASDGIASAMDSLPKRSQPAFLSAAPADVLKGDHINDAAIAAAEASGDNAAAASANYIAGRFSLEQGNRDAALRYLDRALRFEPENAEALTTMAAVLVRVGRPEEAIPLAERATRADADSPDAWAVLGYARMQADHTKEAIPAFENSLKLRPDELVSEFLRRAKRESSTESDYLSAESSHFTLRFEGHTAPSKLARAVLEALDSDYNQLVSQLGVAPRGSIPVILYTDQEFFDVTRAPAWTGAVNDGKLRIPVSGVTEVDGEFARVLRHELSHSFITQITRGRCPFWLNEGVAQLLEPKSLGSQGQFMSRIFRAGRALPLSSLERSFLGMDANSAALAYAESLTAAEYVEETYGMSELRRLLERIGEGASTESALRATFNVGYGQFEQDIGTYLKSRYGE